MLRTSWLAPQALESDALAGALLILAGRVEDIIAQLQGQVSDLRSQAQQQQATRHQINKQVSGG